MVVLSRRSVLLHAVGVAVGSIAVDARGTVAGGSAIVLHTDGEIEGRFVRSFFRYWRGLRIEGRVLSRSLLSDAAAFSRFLAVQPGCRIIAIADTDMAAALEASGLGRASRLCEGSHIVDRYDRESGGYFLCPTPSTQMLSAWPQNAGTWPEELARHYARIAGLDRARIFTRVERKVTLTMREPRRGIQSLIMEL